MEVNNGCYGDIGAVPDSVCTWGLQLGYASWDQKSKMSFEHHIGFIRLRDNFTSRKDRVEGINEWNDSAI